MNYHFKRRLKSWINSRHTHSQRELAEIFKIPRSTLTRLMDVGEISHMYSASSVTLHNRHECC